MSELTVEQVEWLDNYLRSLGKPDSFGPHGYRYDAKPIDLTYALIADWHRQREEIERLRAVLSHIQGLALPSASLSLHLQIELIVKEAQVALKEKGPQR